MLPIRGPLPTVGLGATDSSVPRGSLPVGCSPSVIGVLQPAQGIKRMSVPGSSFSQEAKLVGLRIKDHAVCNKGSSRSMFSVFLVCLWAHVVMNSYNTVTAGHS